MDLKNEIDSQVELQAPPWKEYNAKMDKIGYDHGKFRIAIMVKYDPYNGCGVWMKKKVSQIDDITK